MGRPKKIIEGEIPLEGVKTGVDLAEEGADKTVVTETLNTKEEGTITSKEFKKEEQTIELKKSDYDKLMAQLERNAKDIDLLYKASDKHRMAKAMNQGGEILVHTAKIWTWDNTGKIVIATNLLSNRCEVVQGKWIEDQQVAVVLEDGETITVPYLEFSRKILNKIVAEIVGTTKERDRNNNEVVILKLQLPNGKKLEINQAFVN